MASSGDGEPVQYLYTPDLDDEFYQQNLMLTHPTNILKLDDGNPSTAAGGSRFDGEMEDPLDYDQYTDDEPEESIELSPGGVLDEETVSRGLSNLGRNADGTYQVFLDCAVSGHCLSDISLLKTYIHLQKVDVSYNNLKDIRALSSLHHMIELDSSHNQLTECLALDPAPANLRYADFSFNAITEIPDLSGYGCLEHLNLDNNSISAMQGLSNCKRLRSLSLAHNHIKKMEGMTGLNIRNLCLKYNELTAIEDLETLTNLQTIDLSGNKIRSLLGLHKHDLLETIDLESNEVIDISEVKFIKDLNMLRDLNLLRNPIQELPDYRLLILYRIPRLKDLDRRKVDVKEKVSASNLFDPAIEVIAQRDHVMHVVYSFLQPKHIMESTLASVETPYPMLVLVGPQGAGKKDLAQKLVEEFSDYFGYGVCHTTRKRQPEEVHGKDYKFVSIDEFEELIKLGCFVQTNMYNGQWYGLSTDSIETVAAEGLASVVNMELEGVLTLKKTHFAPRYVLILPMSSEAHEKRLKSRNMYSDAHIADILKRTDMYTEYNQNHPGFFDFMINSDDIGEAYKTLRRLILEYLGMTLNSTEGSLKSGTPDRRSVGSGSCKQDSRPTTGNKNYINLHHAEGQPKGSVLEASFIRRKEQAMDAVIGYIPTLYEQMVHRMPRTAPADLPTQLGLDGLRPTSQGVHPTSMRNETSSSSGSSSSSSLSSSSSSSSSSGSSSRSRSGTDSVMNTISEDDGNLPMETINRMQLMSASVAETELAASTVTYKGEPDRPTSSRMGSARLRVLPPIASPGLDKPPALAV